MEYGTYRQEGLVNPIIPHGEIHFGSPILIMKIKLS